MSPSIHISLSYSGFLPNGKGWALEGALPCGDVDQLMGAGGCKHPASVSLMRFWRNMHLKRESEVCCEPPCISSVYCPDTLWAHVTRALCVLCKPFELCVLSRLFSLDTTFLLSCLGAFLQGHLGTHISGRNTFSLKSEGCLPALLIKMGPLSPRCLSLRSTNQPAYIVLEIGPGSLPASFVLQRQTILGNWEWRGFRMCDCQALWGSLMGSQRRSLGREEGQ